MRINSSPLNFPMFLVAAASILAAIYTSTPAQARDLVGAQPVAKARTADRYNSTAANNKKASRLANAKASDINEAVAASMLVARGEGSDAARKAEFARRLFWVMLSMR